MTNPYPGPRPFVTGESLYGRDREVTRLFYLLSAERIVVLHSPSGAGKSSLLNAGLVPRLRGERFDVWRTIRLSQPAGSGDNRFVRSTVSSLEEGLPEKRRRPPEEIADLTLAEYVAGRPRQPGAPASVVLVFDQFEEILTLDPLGVEERREFFRQLGGALENPEIWALFALREDYLGALDPYRDNVPTRLSNTFRVDLLTVDAATNAIARPAKDAGREFAPDAAFRLANDLATISVQRPDGSFEEKPGVYVEPLQLQVVCRRLWDGLPADTRTIGVENLLESGDVDAALAGYYDDSVAEIAGADVPAERGIREWFGDRLITPSGIRGQVLREQAASGGLDNGSVDRLVATHLVRSEQRDGKTWFELAHDRLVTPVRESNAAWLEQRLHPMQRQAALWEREGRPDSLLLRGQELEAAEAWAQDNPTSVRPIETDLLTASADERQAERRRHRRLLVVIGVGALLLAVMAIVTIFALEQRSEARAQQRLAQAGELAARASAQLGVDPQRALVLAVKSVERKPTAQGEDVLRQALLRPHELAILPSDKRVNAASFSSNGTLVATASDDGTARVWESASGKLVQVVRQRGPVHAASLSPDGKLLLTGGSNRIARIWRVKDGKELHTLPSGAVKEATFSPDGRLAVTGSSDGTVRLWQTRTGRRVLLVPVGRPFEHVELSRDDRLLLVVSGGRARIFDAKKGRLPRTLGEAEVTTASFSPKADLVVTGSGNRDRTAGTAAIWSVKTGERLHPLASSSQGAVTSASFGPSGGKLVVTTSTDGTSRVWKVSSGELFRPLVGHRLRVVNGSWSDDGKWFVTASDDGTARVWRPATGQLQAVLHGHLGAVVDASFSRDGARVATASTDGTARIWNPETAPELKKKAGPKELQPGSRTLPLESGAWSRDGKRVAIAVDGEVLILNDRWRVVRRLKQEGPVVGAKFSRRGEPLLVSAGGRVVRLRRPNGGTLRVEVIPQGANIKDFALSEDGRFLAAAGSDGLTRVWRTADGTSVTVLHQPPPVTAVGFSPDARVLVTGAEDGVARIWDVDRKTPLRVRRVHHGAITSAVFSPDGRSVLTASDDHDIRVWHLAKGQTLLRHAHTGPVSAASYSPDGRWIVTACPSSAGLWNAKTLELILYLHGHDVAVNGHKTPVNDAVFSPGGTRILTAGGDGTVRVYDCLPCSDVDHLLKAARDRLRNLAAPLTRDQRRKYLRQ